MWHWDSPPCDRFIWYRSCHQNYSPNLKLLNLWETRLGPLITMAPSVSPSNPPLPTLSPPNHSSGGHRMVARMSSGVRLGTCTRMSEHLRG